ncbi:MAG: site-2 protease family protein [Coriobacteriia bacterium]|nr:site-2 protease family protein [Coriobacteriia bacterium]
MFDIPSVRIGRVFGIPIEINLSWLVIFGLVAFSLATAVFPAIEESAGAPRWLFAVVGATTALLFFASILAHELCHSLVAKAEGGSVEKITLFIFGGVAQIDEEPRSPGKEFLMAAAGPGMSLLIAGASFYGYVALVAGGAAWWAWAPLEYLAGINLFVALFNLLPGFPLDGGRVLRSMLWAATGDVLKATRWASRSGQFIGWTMVVWAVVGVVGGQSGLIWFGLVGWFIASLAGQAYRQQLVRSRVEGVTVAEVMTPNPEYVSGDLTLDELVHNHFLGGHHARYPVISEGSIVGLVTLPEVKSVDRADWPFVKTIDVTNRDLNALVVPSDAPVEALVPRLAGDRPGALIVSGGGRLVGIVTRADVIALIEGPPSG